MKEQTVRAPALDRPLTGALQRWLVPALFVVLAVLVTTGYGGGVQLNDGQAGLHINPLQFLGRLLHAWNPALSLGTHTGYWVPYQMPYSWVYGVAQLLRIPQDLAQHCAVFLVYLGCLWSMYYCLRSVAPWLDEVARIAGSCAYLFNMYVALNSQAQIVWLLTYATLPAMVGVTARTMRGEMNLWRGALAIALLLLAGGGVNPPLVAVNVIVLALFVVVTIVFDPKPSAALNRAAPIAIAASVAALAINLYWIVPFVDFFRGVWINGILSEAPSMHNAATSFANVLRGLGHWATFVSFDGRAYFPWANAYASGIFGALLWFVPIVALGGIAFKRNQRPITLFFLLVTIVSIPIVVGYYHDELGDAVTTPLYDQFYRNFPGFQMFRFSYKWVAGVEFGVSGLYALGLFAIVGALREYLAGLGSADRRNWAWLVTAARAAVIAVPILAFAPVVIDKMNYPSQPIPQWEYRESSLVGGDLSHRVALFPTQYLEQFDWGNPQFYIEDSLIERPMVYGLLGSEPSEGSDMWVRRAYRSAREGLPFSGDMFRAMGVDTVLQRDDFIPAIDFSSLGEKRFNSTTLTHDLLNRVVGATPVRSDGPLRVYHIANALPLFYGVTHPVVSTVPTYADAYLGNVHAMAQGVAQFDPPARSQDEFSTLLQSLSPILPGSASEVRDLAVNQALAQGIRIHPPSADTTLLTRFTARSAGVYDVFAMDEGLLYDRPPPQTLAIDGKYLTPQDVGGAWTGYGTVALGSGGHWVSDGYLDPDLVVALVNADDFQAWRARILALQRALPKNLATVRLVYAPKTTVTVPASARYRISATSVGAFGPDGLVRARLRGSTSGSFPSNLSGTLPYVLGSGIAATSPLMMLPQWYREDPTIYQWQRGDPVSWFLFGRKSQLRVFVPGGDGVRAQVAMRVSRLQVSGLMTVSENGAVQNVSLPGPAGDDQAYDTIDRIEGPPPVAVRFPVVLRPGWNEVTFTFNPMPGERVDLGPNVLSAAVAPDLSVTQIAKTGRAASKPDRTFTSFALAVPASGLTGDPDVVGTITHARAGSVSLAVALSRNGSVVYRLFPVARDGSFDVNVLHAFPNGWNDASLRIVGMWFLALGSHPSFDSLYYGLHALPAENLKRRSSFTSLPIRVDGKLVGTTTLFLGRGKHVVQSVDRQANIGLLDVDPVALPRTRDFTLNWQRRSPTAIDVTAKNTGTPFLLVFGEAYHPEWTAKLNGQVLPHVIVNGVANGWIVPSLPNGGQIQLTFTGQAYYLVAAAISLISLIIMGVLAWAPELWPIGTPES